MINTWEEIRLTKLVKLHRFKMPVTLNADMELEFEPIRGSQIPKLIEFWEWHYRNGSLKQIEFMAIAAIILYQYETEMEKLNWRTT